MAIIKSSADHIVINADGASKDIKFQANGVEKASISSAGAFTSTTIDATKLTGNLPAISGASLTNLPGGGKVLQVVNMSSGSDTTYNSTSWNDTMYTLNITPSSTSSKILVMWDDEVTVQGDTNFGLRLRRSGTTAVIPYASAGNFGSSNQHGGGYGFHYLDSPSSTSALTYVVQVIRSGSGSLRINGEGGTGSYTLMEIGA